jgi:hypothetical protein
MIDANAAHGKVFISYVREDSLSVDELQATLEEAGLEVWRDTKDLWPGQDWKHEIAMAIREGSLVFMPCFSSNSEARRSTYQNEEILLAIDEFRLMPPFAQWILPVRFEKAAIPSYDLGAGRTLRSLQAADLYGGGKSSQLERLVLTVTRLLDEVPRPKEPPGKQRSSQERLKLLPNYYPPHIQVDELASKMTVAVVDDLDRITREGGIGLYSSFSSYAPSRNAFETLASEHRLVLLGDPGSGKSTILAGFCAARIERGAGLTFFARLEEVGALARQQPPSTPLEAARIVISAWEQWLGSISSSGLIEQLARRIIEDELVLLAFDGWDEVSSPDRREGALSVLTLLAGVAPRILVASRVTGYVRPLPNSVEYLVERLPLGGPSSFVELWFSSGTGPERDRALEALQNSSIHDAARIPLISGFLCFVAENERIESTVAGLYRQYLGQLLLRRWKPATEQRKNLAEIAQALDFAKKAAWSMAAQGHPVESANWLDTATLEWILSVANLDSRALELYERDGLLIPYGIANDTDVLSQRVRWLHRTLHEHLVGRVLAEHVRQDVDLGMGEYHSAVLRRQWQVSLEHASSFLADWHLLELVLDRLLTAAEKDTPTGRYTIAVLDIAHRLAPEYRKDLLAELAEGAGEWRHLARLRPNAIVEAVNAFDPTATHHVALIDLGYAALSIDPSLFSFEAVRRFRDQAEPWARGSLDELLRQINPTEAIELFLSEMEAGEQFPYLLHMKGATPAQLSRVMGNLRRAIARGSDSVADWVRVAALTDLDSQSELETTIRKSRKCSTFLMELARAEAKGEAMKLDNVVTSDIRDISRGAFGDRQSTALGWFVYERARELKIYLEGWALLGYRMASTDWKAISETSSLDHRRALLALQPDGAWSRLLSLDNAEEWFDALLYLHANPASDLVEAFLDIDDQSDERNSAHPLSMDSVWLTQFKNSIPWRTRFEAAVRLMKIPRSECALAHIWTELVDPLHMAADESSAELEKYVARAVRLLIDARFSDSTMFRQDFPSTLPTADEASTQSKIVKTCLRLAVESKNDALIALMRRWADRTLFGLDVLAEEWPF